MISDRELEQLRYKGESVDLDFKQAQYAFIGVTDHQKSELLKDLLAMANSYRSGPGYILIGFEDKTPYPAQVVGISADDHIDDADLQQFVRTKVDPPLEFQYEERLFDGKHIAVFTIPKQVRPFALTRDYGKLRKSVVYVRRGSSTTEASMYETSNMVIADAGVKKTPLVELRIDTDKNEPLPFHVALTFLEFGKLPDYQEDNRIDMGNGFSMPMPSTRWVNRDYYRDGAEYYAAINRAILIRLSLTNRSDFALQEAKLELQCSEPLGRTVRMLRADDLPQEPSMDGIGRALQSVAARLPKRVHIDERASQSTCHVLLGTLRPGETGTAETDVALLPAGPGDYVISIRILAKEIAKPLHKDHPITITGEIRRGSLESLTPLLDGGRRDEAE